MSRRGAALAISTVAATAVAAVTLAGPTGATRPAEPAQSDLIERFTVRLDSRCHVAVLRMRLSRRAPVGIIVQRFGRVPLGIASASTAAAATVVNDVKIWDLTLSNGVELRPGRYRVVLRALSADRDDVLDVSEAVAYTVPLAFARPPTRCGTRR